MNNKGGMAEALLSEMGKAESGEKKADKLSPMDTALRRAYKAAKADNADDFMSAMKAAIKIGKVE